MTKLIDLDQYITVPITDDHGEYTVEITVGEFFKRFLPGEQLKVVDAIPVEWLEEHDGENISDSDGNIYGRRYITISEALSMWQKEQEARQ